MIQLSNKNSHATKIEYVDRIVEVPVETIVHAKTADTIIQYVDRETIKEILVPGDTIVMEAQKIDLDPLHAKDQELEHKIQKLGEIHNNLANSVINELEMQRRALVSLKMQRDVDRKRRLQLINKLRKFRDDHKTSDWKYKAGIGISLLLHLAHHFIK